MSANVAPSTDTDPDAAGIYIHVPFCSAICPYCDFAVVRDRSDTHAGYVDSLVAEMAARADEIAALGAVDTIYFGGGTPSLLSAGDLEAIFGALDARFDLADDTAIFFEANPEDIDRARIATWRGVGVRVLTLGVQALDDPSLGFLGRRHTADGARRAIELALEAGFETVSFDLIYGLPNQQQSDWSRTLEAATELGSQHLSCYQLTIEPKTPFAKLAMRGNFVPLPDQHQADLFLRTHEHLGAHGFEGYEVSNFAEAPRHRSKHNQKYWRHAPYLGFGPSAHSFDGRVRRWNERHIRRWQRRLAEAGTAEAGSERLSNIELAFETLMLGLRTRAGVDLAACRRLFGIDLEAGNTSRIERLQSEGLLSDASQRLVPTLRGMAVADSLARQWAIGNSG